MNRFRQALRRHRLLFLAFLLVETFYSVGGLGFIEAQELRRQEARRELAETARVFGLSAEDLLAEPSDPLADMVGEVKDRATKALESISEKLTPLTLTLSPAEGERGPESESGGRVLADSRSWEGGGVSRQGHSNVASDFSHSRGIAAPPQRPRPRLRRSAAPPRATTGLADGEGEQTHARTLAEASAVGEGTAERLPLRQIERKARTVDASALPPAQRISSAIAPPSAPLAVGQRANKAIAPELTALAASLGNSPGRIFTHVSDTIAYDAKWGADSPPLGTLWEGRGTSWDQAWLLQDLLIAAGVDARLEWGEVEIDPALLLEITGVDDPIRAGDLLTTAGLPVILVVAGSQVISARMPHVWVKAHLDYIPNRGATAGDGDTWIRLDPTLQTFDRTDGERLDDAVPFGLADHLQSGIEVSPRDEYEAALLAYAADQGITTLDALKPLRAPHAEDFPFVPGTLRAKILSVTGESATLPDSHAVRLDLAIRQAGGPALASWSAPLATVYGGLLELRWPGATSADQATLDLFGGVYGTPPYEVDLRPSLLLDGVEVATGTAIGSAEDAELAVTLTPPGGLPAGDGLPIVARWDLFAGEHGALDFDFGATPQEVVDTHLAEAATATDPTSIEAASLAAAGARYLRSQALDLDHLAALRWHRPLNIGTAVFAVQRGAVSTNADGTPDTFSIGPLSLDVGARTLGLFPVDGVQVSTVPTMELLGAQGSIREGEALASVFGGDHVTAVGFLTLAVREGQALTRVDATNVDAALAAATLSRDAEAAVEFAVAQGAIAWIAETQLELNGWRTTGYILEDPATGAGGYFVTFERRFTPLDGAVIFHSPSDLDIVTAPTDVVATIDVEGIESWTLSTRPTGGEGTTVIATGIGPVQETFLGTFDPTLLLNGMHDLVLTGQDSAGQAVSGKITVVVEGEMKIGHFTLSFIDLAIPLAGLDIEVVRTYDSRQRLEKGDFGQGWSLDIRQGSYENNRPPGDGWQILNPGGQLGLPCTQVKETKTHLTTIRLSDREVYEFRLKLRDTGILLGGCFARASFDFVDGPLPGSTLEILGNNEVFYENASERLLDLDSLELFVPQGVKLTTRDGRIFHLDLETGVTHLEDTHANAVEITTDGIIHSSGVGIDFDRDAEGRITTITDPRGNANLYTYDTEGDLEVFTNRVGGMTRFTYGGGHYLEEIENDLGIAAVRTEYDDEGRMVRMTDSTGKVVDFGHDLDTRREVITNRLGGTRVLEYDDRGQVVREIDENGEATTRTFDGRGNMLSETDPLGRTLSYAYTANNEVSKVVDPAGNIRRYTYDEFGQTETYEDPLGNVFANTYDGDGKLLEAVDALGQITHFTYDSSGNLRSVTDPEGLRFESFYDSQGNQIRAIDGEGNESFFDYDGNGNLLTRTQTRTTSQGVRTLVTEWTYDAFDRAIAVTTPDGATRSWEFDGIGQIVRVVDPMGQATLADYDDRGRLERLTFPDATTEQRLYDDEGRIVGRVDRAGHSTVYDWDPAGNLLQTTFADGSRIENRYDDAGQLIAEIDELGATTQYVRDSLGQTLEIIDALGGRVTFGYDAAENMVSMTDAKGQTTGMSYDALGQLVRVDHPDATFESFTYDSRGRRRTESDAAGNVTTYGYDANGRLAAVRDALANETVYEYDEVGNRLAMTDANGHQTRFEFDDSGRPTRRVLSDGSAESWTYRADGLPASHTGFLGSITSFEYDTAGRLLRRDYPDGSAVQFTYDAVGQRLTATDARGVTNYAYDVRGRLTELRYPDGRRLDYGYDLAGQQTERSATVGGQTLTTRYAYDALGQQVSVTDPGGKVYALDYDANGNLIETLFPNGVVSSTSFDTRNRPVASSVAQSASGTVLQSANTLFTPRGQRQQVTEEDGTSRTYAYDAVGRLTQERVVDSVGSLVFQNDFTWDAVGNQLTRRNEDDAGTVELTSRTYDARDRLLDTGDVALTWDDAGRLVGRTGDQAATFEWDFDDRLTRALLADGTEILYTYDADGNRVRVEITPPNGPPSVVDLLVDPTGGLSRVVAESDASGALLAHYVLGDEPLAFQPTGGDERFYHPDALGSIRLLTDAAGAVTDRTTYDAFGQVVDQVGSTATSLGFTGQRFEASIGLYYHRARWMDPTVGRFVSMDPFPGFSGSPTSLNKYAYANSDPVNVIDPTGLFGFADVSIANAIRGIVSQIQIDIGFDILMQVDTSGDISKLALLFLLATGGFALAKGIIWAAKGGFKTLISKAKTVFFDRAKRAFRDSRTGRFAARHQILKAEQAAFESLAEYRKSRGLAAAGSAEDISTTARLDIDGQTFFGHNAHGSKVDIKVNAQTKTHAEGHVFQQAKDAGVQAPQATLYVDRPLCKACGANGGVGSLMRGTGVDELIVVAPDGRFRITASRPSTPVPIDLP